MSASSSCPAATPGGCDDTGTYVFTVTDSIGKMATAAASINHQYPLPLPSPVAGPVTPSISVSPASDLETAQLTTQAASPLSLQSIFSATVTGGTAPISYAWTQVSGNAWSFTVPSMPGSNQIRLDSSCGSFPTGCDVNGTYQVTATDAAGKTASGQVTLEHRYNPPPSWVDTGISLNCGGNEPNCTFANGPQSGQTIAMSPLLSSTTAACTVGATGYVLGGQSSICQGNQCSITQSAEEFQCHGAAPPPPPAQWVDTGISLSCGANEPNCIFANGSQAGQTIAISPVIPVVTASCTIGATGYTLGAQTTSCQGSQCTVAQPAEQYQCKGVTPPPAVAPTWAPALVLGTAYTGQAMTTIAVASATDNNGLVLSYSVVSGMPPGVSFNTSTLQFSGTPTTAGNYSIVVSASDTRSSTSKTFTLSVISAAPPTWAPTLALGTAFSGQAMTPITVASATDNNGLPLTYAVVSGMPAGVSFNTSTLQFSGTPTTAGSYSIVISVSDAKSGISKTFTLSVTTITAPTWTPTLALGTVYTGQAMTPITVASATDNNGLSLTYSVVSGMPAGVSFGTSTLQFSGTPTTVGSYSIVIKASDSVSSTSKTFTLSVASTSAPSWSPTLALGTVLTGVAVTPITIAPATDNNGLTLTYSAVSGMPTGMSLSTSPLQLQGTPTTAGAYSIVLKAADSKSSTSETFTLTVSAPGTRVFETVKTTSGFFGFGTQTTDALCSSDSNNPKDGRTYVTLASTQTVNAKSRFTLTYPVVTATASPKIITTSNFFFATGTTVQWSTPISATGALAWTGSNADGTYDSASGGSCSNWSSTTGTGQVGNPASTTGLGIADTTASCGTVRPLICVSTTP